MEAALWSSDGQSAFLAPNWFSARLRFGSPDRSRAVLRSTLVDSHWKERERENLSIGRSAKLSKFVNLLSAKYLLSDLAEALY